VAVTPNATMQRIRPYALSLDTPTTHKMPVGATKFSLVMQDDTPVLFMRLTPSKLQEERTFVVLPAAPEPRCEPGWVGLGTVERMQGKFIHHVFEVPNAIVS
jgi:hypothetical protein